MLTLIIQPKVNILTESVSEHFNLSEIWMQFRWSWSLPYK